MIKIYRHTLSLFLGGNCRFYPSCSEYSEQCFERFNFGKAVYLTGRRLAKCHPFGPSGLDPAPEQEASL